MVTVQGVWLICNSWVSPFSLQLRSGVGACVLKWIMTSLWVILYNYCQVIASLGSKTYWLFFLDSEFHKIITCLSCCARTAQRRTQRGPEKHNTYHISIHFYPIYIAYKRLQDIHRHHQFSRPLSRTLVLSCVESLCTRSCSSWSSLRSLCPSFRLFKCN